MNTFLNKFSKSLTWVMSLVMMVAISAPAFATIPGATSTAITAGSANFSLSASDGYITTPDGDSLLIWGYSDDNAGSAMQIPGPTLIVNQGDVVTVTLSNKLNVNNDLQVKTSLIFPGQTNVTSTGGTPGFIAAESSSAADVVTYTFTAGKPGTYMYQSGSNQEVQLEMGLSGTIIVRPTVPVTTPPTKQAYGTADTAYDYEYLFFFTEMDPAVHYAVEEAKVPADLNKINNIKHHPVLWFINGRNGPDTLTGNFEAYLPHQPLGSIAEIHPGDNALLRFVNAGRDLHPFHTHGNHFRLLARDGQLNQTAAGAIAGVADLVTQDFTLQAVPGATYDALWTWTGEKMGWDIFGDPAIEPLSAHSCSGNNLAIVPAIINCPDGVADGGTAVVSDGFNDVSGAACYDFSTREYCPDHNKPFPVTLTNQAELAFGGFFSGSPFFGSFSSLPPGEGGLNLTNGMFYMWHSHNEREIVNNDIYPGGMLTMMVVQPMNVIIE